MAHLILSASLWCSLVAVAVAFYLGLQQPLQEILMPASSSQGQIFCYDGGVTAKFSTSTKASCFTVKDGLFVDVFTPTSEPPVEPRQGHAIPGLWDGVSQKSPRLVSSRLLFLTSSQHGHVAQYGEFLHSADLFGASSIDDVHTKLAAYLSEHQGAGGKDDWIRGMGWDQMALGAMPTAVRLSQAGSSKPRRWPTEPTLASLTISPSPHFPLIAIHVR